MRCHISNSWIFFCAWISRFPHSTSEIYSLKKFSFSLFTFCSFFQQLESSCNRSRNHWKLGKCRLHSDDLMKLVRWWWIESWNFWFPRQQWEHHSASKWKSRQEKTQLYIWGWQFHREISWWYQFPRSALRESLVYIECLHGILFVELSALNRRAAVQRKYKFHFGLFWCWKSRVRRISYWCFHGKLRLWMKIFVKLMHICENGKVSLFTMWNRFVKPLNALSCRITARCAAQSGLCSLMKVEICFSVDDFQLICSISISRTLFSKLKFSANELHYRKSAKWKFHSQPCWGNYNCHCLIWWSFWSTTVSQYLKI